MISEKDILELAENNKKNPKRFFEILNEKTKQENIEEPKNRIILQTAELLFARSYYELTDYLFSYLLEEYIKNDNKESELFCYIHLCAVNRYLDQSKMNQIKNKAVVLDSKIHKETMLYDICLFFGNQCSTKGNNLRALDYFQLFLDSEILDEKNFPVLCSAMALSYHYIGNHELAKKYASIGLQKSKETKQKIIEARCYLVLGLTYQFYGNFGASFNYYKKAREISEESELHDELLYYHIDISALYSTLNKYNKVIDHNKTALSIISSIENSETFQNDENEYRLVEGGKVRCYGNLGNAYASLGKVSLSIENHLRSIEIARELRDSYSESMGCVNLAVVYLKFGSYKSAITLLKEAIRLKEIIDDKSGLSICYTNLGYACEQLKDPESESHYRKAIKMAKEIKEIKTLIMSYYSISKFYFDSKPNESFQYLEEIIEYVDNLDSRNIESDLTKVEFYNLQNDIYQLMILLCLKLDKNTDAFNFAERSKSRAFLTLLSSGEINPRKKIPKNLLDQELELQNKKKKILLQKESDVKIDPNEAENIQTEINELYKKIKPYDKDYVYLRQSKIVEIDQIKNLITDGSVIVEFYVEYSRLIIFIITTSGLLTPIEVKISKKDLFKKIEEYRSEIKKCTDLIEKENRLPKNEEVLKNIMKELGTLFLGSIKSYLVEKEIVYFVPHGILHYIPLHSLIIDDDPLIRSKSVVYIPSVSILQFLNRRKSEEIRTGSIFTATKHDDDQEFRNIITNEGKNIAKIFGINAEIEATKKNVLESIEKESGIIHFSCHGVFHKTNPLSSGILFHSERSSKKDLLTAREIFSLKLNASLITLSACDTGMNEISPGDDLLGLTRAFLYAGASSLIVSLWSPDAVSTKDMMSNFYNALKEKSRNNTDFAIAKSIQHAQNLLMNSKDNCHPYLWAAFVVIGNP